MLFKEIPGNKIVKEQLIATVNKNRVSHAQIFSGRSGSAKLALALAYARYLNCDKKLNTDVWYDEETLNWVKATFEKKGKWEYKLVEIR